MATTSTICKNLGSLEPGDTDTILRAIRDSLKTATPLEKYWEYISPALMRSLDEEQLNLIHSGNEEILVHADIQKGNTLSELVVAQHYLIDYRIVEHQGQITLVKVINEEDKTVLPLYEKDYLKILKRELSLRWLNETGEPVSPSRAAELVQYWFNHEAPIDMPEPMGLPGDNRWCLHRSKYFPDSSIEFPSWKRILNRMSDQEAFAAWQYGVWSGLYKGRQLLWVHGPHGEDGKSAVAKIIGQNLYGPAHNAISNASISSGEKRFLTSFFENAALVIYPDASNRRCLMSETFKTVASAGSDPVLIERKGKQAYTSTLKACMWISSNYAPEVTNNNFITSRLLYIYIDKMVDEKPDPTVFGRLEAELPGFLAYAEDCYKRLCPDNYKIETKSTTDLSVKSFTDSFYDEYRTIFTKHWEVADEDDQISASKVRDILRTEGMNCNRKYGDFIRWLTEHQGVVKWKDSSSNGVVYYKHMKPRTVNQLNASTKPDF
ncbi:MAG: DUF5906 domain-containing protein [Colwellia sp.]|nr:DUF5906 domain-containing protein [Colwellia sp.]